MLRLLLVLMVAAGAAGQPAVSCESPNGVYQECRIALSGRVRLVFERSEGRCVEGATWGTRTDGVVWVDRGCRATFTVDTRTFNTIVCESQDGKMQTCPADTSKGVTLRRQLSKTECVHRMSWGWDPERREIWVNDGCRAEFFLGQQLLRASGTETLDGLVTCESDDGRRKVCAADTSAGVQFVRQLGETACAFNTGWGYDQKGIWVNKGCRAEFAIRGRQKAMMKGLLCESTGGRVHCPAETQFGIALIKQLDERRCVLDETWGFDDQGVWVDNCRGQFILGGYRLPESGVPPTAMRLTCESVDRKHNVCAVATDRGVGLVKQLSETTCVLNRTWGYDGTGIWVSDGCRAEFVVAR